MQISETMNIEEIPYIHFTETISLEYLNQCKVSGLKILKNLIFDHLNINEICQFLEKNDIFMSIENCIIDSIDLPTLGNSILKSTKLKKLHLNFSNFEWTSFASFCSIIAINESLDELDLSGNNIGDESSISINEIILSHKSLKNLNLSHNNLSESSCKNIVCSMELNTVIQSLNLFGNYANSDTFDKLTSLIVRNREYSSKFKSISNQNKLSDDAILTNKNQYSETESKKNSIENELNPISENKNNSKENSICIENITIPKIITEDKCDITEENSYKIKNDNEILKEKMNSNKTIIDNLQSQIELLNHNYLSLDEKNKILEESKLNVEKELELTSSKIKDELCDHFLKEKANLIDEFTKKLQILKKDNEILSKKNKEINEALKKIQAQNYKLYEPLKEVTNLRQHNQNLTYTVNLLNKNLSLYQEGMNNSMQALNQYQISQRNLEAEKKLIASNVQNYIIPEIKDKISRVETLTKTLQDQTYLAEYYKNLLSQEKLFSQSLLQELEEYKALYQSQESIGSQSCLVDQLNSNPQQYIIFQNNDDFLSMNYLASHAPFSQNLFYNQSYGIHGSTFSNLNLDSQNPLNSQIDYLMNNELPKFSSNVFGGFQIQPSMPYQQQYLFNIDHN